MDNLDNKMPSPTGASDLQAQFDSLRHLVVSILILVIVISGTLNIYLLRQWRSVSKDLAGVRPQAAQMVAEYQKVSGPMMQDFVKKLADYARTNPDFAPVLAKYHIQTAEATGAPPASAAAPRTVPATAKPTPATPKK
jgi:hypothetical protein